LEYYSFVIYGWLKLLSKLVLCEFNEISMKRVKELLIP